MKDEKELTREEMWKKCNEARLEAKFSEFTLRQENRYKRICQLTTIITNLKIEI